MYSSHHQVAGWSPQGIEPHQWLGNGLYSRHIRHLGAAVIVTPLMYASPCCLPPWEFCLSAHSASVMWWLRLVAVNSLIILGCLVSLLWWVHTEEYDHEIINIITDYYHSYKSNHKFIPQATLFFIFQSFFFQAPDQLTTISHYLSIYYINMFYFHTSG